MPYGNLTGTTNPGFQGVNTDNLERSTVMVLPSAVQRMPELQLILPELERMDASIPIRWCISTDAREELRSRGAEDIHIFVVVCSMSGDTTTREDRYIFPLNQMMGHIKFHRHGLHRILATTIYPYSSARYFRRLLEKVSPQSYRYPVLHADNLELNTAVCSYNYGQAEVEITVSPDFFEPEPAAWEQWWVNLWHDYPPENSCQFGSRRPFAYTLQPPLVLLWLILVTTLRLLLALFCSSVGWRNVDYRAVFHPFNHQIEDVVSKVQRKNNVFLSRPDGTRRSRWLLLLSPYVILLFAFLAWTVMRLFSRLEISAGEMGIGVREWDIVTVAFLAIAGILVTFVGGRFLWSRPVVGEWWSSVVRRQLEQHARRERARGERDWRRSIERVDRYYQKLVPLTCSQGPIIADIRALPPERRTLRLRLSDMAARRCRPYAR
jgi:hypothetical protein